MSEIVLLESNASDTIILLDLVTNWLNTAIECYKLVWIDLCVNWLYMDSISSNINKSTEVNYNLWIDSNWQITLDPSVNTIFRSNSEYNKNSGN